MTLAALFGLIALGIAGAVELLGGDAPEWLVGLVGAAGGFLFGHVYANGFDGRKNGH